MIKVNGVEYLTLREIAGLLYETPAKIMSLVHTEGLPYVVFGDGPRFVFDRVGRWWRARDRGIAAKRWNPDRSRVIPSIELIPEIFHKKPCYEYRGLCLYFGVEPFENFPDSWGPMFLNTGLKNLVGRIRGDYRTAIVESLSFGGRKNEVPIQSVVTSPDWSGREWELPATEFWDYAVKKFRSIPLLPYYMGAA